MSRVSGPLLDPIDIQIEVPAVKFKDLTSERSGEPSIEIRKRVEKARAIQHERFKKHKHLFCNARMESKEIRPEFVSEAIQYWSLDRTTI